MPPRTPLALFGGGHVGKALVNAYYRSAEALGVGIRYHAPVDALELENGRFKAARIGAERIEARACVLAAGGFESNREWLRDAWGLSRLHRPGCQPAVWTAPPA